MTHSRKGFIEVLRESSRRMAVYGSDAKNGILGLNGLTIL